MNILIIKFCKIKIILIFPTEFRFWLRNSIMVRRRKRSREKNVEMKKKAEIRKIMKNYL